MIPTVFGGIILLLGVYILLWGTIDDALVMTLSATLFGGSAALLLPALGGSSVPPVIVAAVILVGKIAYDRAFVRREIGETLRQSGIAVFFFAYCAVAAFLLPFIFARSMMVAPLKALNDPDLFAVVPLQFSSQNITTIVYLLFTCIGLQIGNIVARAGLGVERLARTAAILTLVHVTFGVYDIATRGTPAWIVIDLFRNAQYAMVEQKAGILPRMAGILPEPSSFAGYGFSLFLLTFELWLRRILTHLTGTAALAILLSLVVSTSSSAYVSLIGYAIILFIRLIYFRQPLSAGGMFAIFMGIVVAGVVILAMAIFLPDLAAALGNILNAMTAGKVDSDSAIQRGFWARQGFEAFKVSWGFGVGPGTFRSSSFATAMLGSVGWPGTLLFLGLVAILVRAIAQCARREQIYVEAAMGAALGWTALVMLVPAATGGPSMDPGLQWGLTVGLACGFAARTELRERLASGRSSPRRTLNRPRPA